MIVAVGGFITSTILDKSYVGVALKHDARDGSGKQPGNVKGEQSSLAKVQGGDRIHVI